MKKLLFFLWMATLTFTVSGQRSKSKSSPPEIKIPMVASYWDTVGGSVEFIRHKEAPALRINATGPKATLKDLIFKDGTIEFDIEYADERFSGIYFREASALESEYFYLRVGRAGIPRQWMQPNTPESSAV